MKQFWIDFAEGRITVPQMLERTAETPALLDWFNAVVPEGTCLRVLCRVPHEDGTFDYVPKAVPFTAQLAIRQHTQRGAGNMFGQYMTLHAILSEALAAAFPEDKIIIDQTPLAKFCFMLDACPQGVAGPEVEPVLDALLDSLPADLPKTKKVKLFKQKLHELFPTATGKWPRWGLTGNWPLGANGKPMRFVGQKRKKSTEYPDMRFTHFFFEDVDTGETRVIEQFP